MDDILLIGGGGHCKSIIDSIVSSEEYNIIGIIDIEEKVGNKILGIDIIGTDDDLMKIYELGVKNAFIATGSIGNTKIRRKIYKDVKKIGYRLPTILDISSIVSKFAKLGEGNFVGKGVIINAGVSIGINSIINTGAILDHDCKIENFVHIGPGSVLSGGVKVGSDSHVGTNSTIIQNIKIGNNVLVGAGSTVISDIKDNVKGFGNPYKEVSR